MYHMYTVLVVCDGLGDPDLAQLVFFLLLLLLLLVLLLLWSLSLLLSLSLQLQPSQYPCASL